MNRGREAAAIAAFLVILGGCTSSTRTASTSPETGSSPSASASASAGSSSSPSASPTGPLTITSVPVHNGELGLSFASIALGAGGGLPPYTWSLQGGALPSGLSLSSQGVIGGSLGKAGTFKFTVAVADSGGSHATKATAITAYSALSVSAACAGQCVVGKGCSKCGGFGTASGGAGPYAFKLVGGGVPPGMSLSGLSLKGGFPAGAYSLTVQVSDVFGASHNVLANWSVYSPATLKSGGDCVNVFGNPPPVCTVRWTYAGGNPNTAPKLVVYKYVQYCTPNGNCQTPSAVPPGWSVKVGGGVVTISAGGPLFTCNPLVIYIGGIQLALQDPSACATTSLSNVVTMNFDIENNC